PFSNLCGEGSGTTIGNSSRCSCCERVHSFGAGKREAGCDPACLCWQGLAQSQSQQLAQHRNSPTKCFHSQRSRTWKETDSRANRVQPTEFTDGCEGVCNSRSEEIRSYRGRRNRFGRSRNGRTTELQDS